MHSAHHGVNRSAVRQFVNVVKRVDNPGMSAAKQHDDALAGVEEHRLIVQEGIRMLALRIGKKWLPVILVLSPARDFAGHEKSVADLRGSIGFDEVICSFANR